MIVTTQYVATRYVQVRARVVGIGMLYDAYMPDGSVLTSADLHWIRTEVGKLGTGITIALTPDREDEGPVKFKKSDVCS